MVNRSLTASRIFVPAPRRAALGLIASAMGLACPLYAASAEGASPDQNAIGIIGKERISEAQVIAANQPDFDRLQSDYELQRRQLELKYAKSRHDLVEQELDKRLDREALDMEAKARGVAPDTVLADLKVAGPTDEEARAFYEAHKERIKQPYEGVAPKVREYLTTQRNQAATRSFYDDLRAKHGIRSTLDRYRVPVAAIGPARGQRTASVTIVEFGDFQCPYCKESESSLRALMDRYPQDVRVVFRQLPLTQIHPNAKLAAEAAICADRQGKFWEMHDAMYEDQSALNLDSLKSTATRLGLNADHFSTCIADGSASGSLDLDAKAAAELGLAGTPYFFINGRPIDGDVPIEKFESIIKDELQSARHHQS
ncbi:MAG TPA: thioredoxin domain-containing protein [Steroidobacteraceae bacterium]|jgi:protein-disulfide isomerase